MAGVNKAIIIGNLGNEPELRYTTSNRAVTELRIATSEQWSDKDGNRQEKTEWHTIVVWGKQAENCERYLSKGRQVYVEGRLQTRSWEDQSGQKRYKTEIIAQNVQFLSGGSPRGNDEPRDRGARGAEGGGREWGGSPSTPAASSKPAVGMNDGANALDDDIPF